MALGGSGAVNDNDRNLSSRRDGNQRLVKKDAEAPIAEHFPRILSKDEDPSLINRNKRMSGQLLGTLERFGKEDKQFSETAAYMRRSDSLKRAEQRAREESEKQRKQERKQIAEKRRRDPTRRARVAAKAEEEKLDLLFLQWSEHHKKLSNFIRNVEGDRRPECSCFLGFRTKTEPPIYCLSTKPLDEDATIHEQLKEQEFLKWKTVRREKLSEYQKQIGEDIVNLQETMDKELYSHRLEHGPKKRKVPGGDKEDDEDDVEDINVGEDDTMMEDVLDVDDNGRMGDEPPQPTPEKTTPPPDNVDRQ